MRRLSLAFLLTLAGAATAALPRVTLQAPLLPMMGPAASILPQVPSASALPVTTLSAAPVALTPAFLPPAIPTAAPVAAPAASAAMDSGVSEGGPASAGPAGVFAHHELEQRLLSRLTLDDQGDASHATAMRRAVRSMLDTPTGRELARQFISEGVRGVVRFEAFEGSRLYDTNGRRIFYAPRAYTDWKGDHVSVRMNLDYLGTDAQFQEQDLPPTLAHELFGHGLWYFRAAAENALQAFHHHELNETNARLVGWLVDFEMDRRFEENGAWNYLQDPTQFLRNLKLRLPYYALTFSNEELARPLEALETRLTSAGAKRTRLEGELNNHRSWNAVIDHFVTRHGMPERHFALLRQTMRDTEQNYRDEVATMDAIISDLEGTIARMKAEPDRQSERYLQWAATHPLFARLEAAARENARRLHELVAKTSTPPASAPPQATGSAAEPESDQLTFDDLMRLYQQDRQGHPDHWRG